MDAHGRAARDVRPIAAPAAGGRSGAPRHDHSRPPLLIGAAPAIGALPQWRERQLAILEPRGNHPRGYLIEAREPGMRLVMRFDQRRWATLFCDRVGLGESGETFLVDHDGSLAA